MATPGRVLAEQPGRVMRSIKDFSGFEIRAKDGEIGKVDDFYFDDISWTIRYLVVNTGGWLTGRQVLLSPATVLQTDWGRKILPVDLRRDQIGIRGAALCLLQPAGLLGIGAYACNRKKRFFMQTSEEFFATEDTEGTEN